MKNEDHAMTAAEADPLLQTKRERQKQDRDDVRSGRHTQASLLFDADDVRRNWVIKRRSQNY
ncbi:MULTISPECIES: hypothetical protein [unclassified Caballeronia]|uniref:hypothetical protein n=1 Tax=unclassified Caballeronia TaxID=2646786 RepID=UPI002029A353|nr:MULTISPECIES: hypothetical protein [unclassified Caballeronia]